MLCRSCSTERTLKLKVQTATFPPKLYLIIDSTEHRHEKYLSKVAQMVQLDNSLNVIDPIFGLLASPTAFQGRGNVHDVECLQVHIPFPFSSPHATDRLQQMAIADLAFTNAKRRHDLDGQVAALIYRALERNTSEGSFAASSSVRVANRGLADGARSPLCTSMKAVNPEIAVLQQMQDPASIGATLHNQAIALELSRQINAVGGDPLKALDAVPEDSSDALGVGHSCNEDLCVYSNNRSQFTVSRDEITRYAVRCIAMGGSPSFTSRTPAECTAPNQLR